MLDLNGKEFQGTTIFNGGNAGKAENVEISVEKKAKGVQDNTPDFKVFATDESGAKINEGFYYPSPNAQKSQEDNEKAANREVGRVVSIARAIVGANYEFPKVTSSAEAFDVLFDIIAQNAPGKKVNIFSTYGNVGYPKKFLTFRYFDFIEDAESPSGKLKPKNNDLMERLEQDAPAVQDLSGGFPTKKETSWTGLS